MVRSAADVSPDNRACEMYWDKTEQAELERVRETEQDNHRKELWAIYSKREPVNLPIVNDGFGWIPKCPMCGEKMTVTVSRYNGHKSGHCEKCGARFIE